MIPRFNSLLDAIGQGYSLPNPQVDKDISEPPDTGYSYLRANGQKTITVWLDGEKNLLGGTGKFQALFPPP